MQNNTQDDLKAAIDTHNLEAARQCLKNGVEVDNDMMSYFSISAAVDKTRFSIEIFYDRQGLMSAYCRDTAGRNRMLSDDALDCLFTGDGFSAAPDLILNGIYLKPELIEKDYAVSLLGSITVVKPYVIFPNILQPSSLKAEVKMLRKMHRAEDKENNGYFYNHVSDDADLYDYSCVLHYRCSFTGRIDHAAKVICNAAMYIANGVYNAGACVVSIPKKAIDAMLGAQKAEKQAEQGLAV